MSSEAGIAIGQVAELGISLLPEDKLRMHFDIDLLVADMQSLQIIFRDLACDLQFRIQTSNT